MRISIKFALLILSMLFLTSTSFSENAFSRLQFSSSNEFSVPLENVSFFLECDSEKSSAVVFPVVGKTLICKSDKTGSCSPSICYACKVNSSATIYAQYYEQEISQPIFRWQGYRYYTDCAVITSPVNQLSPFLFNDYELVINLKDQNEEYVKGAQITLSSPYGFYKECTTDEVGECIFYQIPQGNYGIKAVYKTAEVQSSLNLNDNKVLNLAINIKPRVYYLEFNFFDKTGKSLPGFEVSIYSNNKSSYIINP